VRLEMVSDVEIVTALGNDIVTLPVAEDTEI
jgi:hypothetical protein